MINQNKTLSGSLCAIVCEILFGFSYIFTKSVTETVGPFALLGWRFLLAAIVMTLCILVGIVKIDLKQKPLKPLVLVALFSPCIYFIGETLGISNTTASESGVFLACIPVAALLSSTLILKKKPSGVQVLGILITLLGVTVTVVVAGVSSSFSIVGYMFLLLSVTSYAFYSVFVDKATNYTGAEITYVMLLAGTCVFVSIAIIEALMSGTMTELIMQPFRNRAFFVAILYQGIGCSILAFFLSNVAIARIGVNKTSSFLGVSTVVSIIAGAFLLKERLSLGQIIGAVIILAGVYTANANIFKQEQIN